MRSGPSDLSANMYFNDIKWRSPTAEHTMKRCSGAAEEFPAEYASFAQRRKHSRVILCYRSEERRVGKEC